MLIKILQIDLKAAKTNLDTIVKDADSLDLYEEADMEAANLQQQESISLRMI